MSERQKILITASAILAIIAIAVGGTTMHMLYKEALRAQRELLGGLVLTQSQTIRSVAEYNDEFCEDDLPEGPEASTLAQFTRAHVHDGGFGETGEIVLARRELDEIQFLVARRHGSLNESERIPIESELAEPMRRALNGESGTVIARDYRGATVLAAYEPISALGLGLVAKIDIAELNAPFVRTGKIAALTGIALIGLGLVLLLRLCDPIVRKMEVAVDEMTEARDIAAAANDAKTQFLANTSHEIRTPMAAILGFSEMLRDGIDAKKPVEEVNEILDTISRNGHYLMTIINDILDLSKIEAKKLMIKKSPCSPYEIANEVVYLSQVRATSRGLELRIETEGMLPESIETDPIRLRQILVNLVGNAIKFTQEGSVRIVITLDQSDAPSIVFKVVDTGIGIDEATKEKLFEAFVQSDTTSTRNFGGTGLGLTICKRLTDLLGGRIEASCNPDVGSTFSVSIPYVAASRFRQYDADAQPDGAVSETIEVPSPSSTAPKSPSPSNSTSEGLEGRVLVAEDVPDNQRWIRSYLNSAGLDVDLVDNGQAAVDRALGAVAAGRPYDLIVMDMQMPIMDGRQAVAELRSVAYRGPIIALTAHAMFGDREQIIASGCDDYASKPIDKATLVAICRKWINANRKNAAA